MENTYYVVVPAGTFIPTPVIVKGDRLTNQDNGSTIIHSKSDIVAVVPSSGFVYLKR